MASAPTVEGNGRIGMVIGGVVIAAIAVAITLFAVTHGRREPAVATVTEAGPADAAPVAIAPVDATQVAAVPQGSDAAVVEPSVPDRPAPRHRRGPEPAGGAPSVASGASAAGSAAPGKPGPTIVGGGSAADHGVIVGPGVTTGPGVIIGGQTPAPAREAIERPADYDAKHFDPVAYLPRAQKLARELLPDAQLTTFEFDPVFPDGHVDLTMDGRDRGYDFRSPERSVFPAGRPKNLPFERKCRVMVELTASAISARVVTSDACDARLVRAPRCSLASVWKQALDKGAARDVVARIGWLSDGRGTPPGSAAEGRRGSSDETWFFDLDLAGKGGGVSSFADRCP